MPVKAVRSIGSMPPPASSVWVFSFSVPASSVWVFSVSASSVWKLSVPLEVSWWKTKSAASRFAESRNPAG